MANKTVAILGNASRTRNFAPFDDPSTDLWAMTFHALQAKRVTAVLEMHPDVLTGERWRKFPNYEQYRKWLRETDTPIYMHEALADIPAAVKYPRDEIANQFCRHLWKGEKELKALFGGTASYGIALALYLGYTRIELYGIELSSRPEYDKERDMTFFWLGKASALGVEIVIHEKSRLVSELLYPMRM